MSAVPSTLRICPMCVRAGAVLIYPRADVLPEGSRASMTKYVDDERNLVPEMCDDCYQEYRDLWQERWNDYYADMGLFALGDE